MMFSIEDSAAASDHEDLIETLRSVEGFENQVETFITLMTPGPDAERLYNSIKDDLKSVLEVEFQDFSIRFLGSTAIGLQWKNASDLDMNVLFETRPHKARKCLLKTQKMLIESVLFHSVQFIRNARIPIVRCIHGETSMRCDINFSHLSGVENSRLMKNFLSVDEKLRMAMLVIKYWGQTHDIMSRELSFSKYSMGLMFIFYLQQRHSFPSVCELQQDTVATNPNVKWNMNAASISDSSKITEIHSTSSEELLLGFFEFYAGFDFETFIISPHFGKMIPKTDFKDRLFLSQLCNGNGEYVHSIRTNFRIRAGVCIQDPFELDRSTSHVSSFILFKFISQCSKAVENLTKSREKKLGNLLSTLGVPGSYFRVIIPYSGARRRNTNELEDYLKEAFYERTLHFCKMVFKNILKFEVKSEGRIDRSQAYTVTSTKILWKNRFGHDVKESCVLANLPSRSCDTLERETLISDALVKITDETRFDFALMINRCQEPLSLELEFIQKKERDTIFESFEFFMCNTFLTWLDEYS